ncbi:MAG: Uma2 family endonuclease [Candidatus Rokuibacteriota bacterium]|nr:MAG: Uma2 family endonuclease [Candidatus Rokubacteria bacterium]
MAVAPRVRRFTVDEYERMVDARVFAPHDRIELIEGEIIEMAPIGPPHESAVDRLNMLLCRRVGDRAIVRVQGSVRFRALRSRPQPDLAVLRPRADYYRASGPTADDILLLIEVMDTSVDYDRRTKAPLYARAGVGELWLVDIPAGLVEVHRDPAPAGYRDVRTLGAADTVTPRAFSDLTLRLPEILG